MTAIDINAPSRQVRRALARERAKGGRGTSSSTMHRSAASPVDAGELPGKGMYDGNCNRTACQVSIAGDNWFNTSTRAYYCRRCAHLFNTDSLRFDGIRICVAVEDPETRPPFPYGEMRRFQEERKHARAR